MRQQGKNATVLRFGVSLLALTTAVAVAGCSGGGGGGGGVASTTAPSTSGSIGGVGTSAGTLTAMDVQPQGDLMIDNGMNEGFQLLVDGKFQDDQGRIYDRDITRDVAYSVSDPLVLAVSGDGLVTPVGEGTATVYLEIPGPGNQKIQAAKNFEVVAPTGTPPVLTALALYPPARALPDVNPSLAKEQLQQIVVVATDGSGRLWDLTRKLAVTLQDKPNDATPSIKGKVTPTGLLRGIDNGTIYAVARVNDFALVAGAEIVLGTGVAKPVDPNDLYSGAPLAGSQNPIDVAVLDNLFKQFVEPSPLSSDAEFIRRLYADALGRAPTVAEVDAFVSSQAADKREQEIDAVLANAQFSTYWAGLMSEWFEINRNANGDMFEAWAAGEITKNTPLADMVSEMAKGNVASFETQHDNAAKKVDILLLAGSGMTAKCAVCHDHPLVGPNDPIKWTQAERYPLDAFFAINASEATALDKTSVRVGNPYQPGFILDPTKPVTSTLTTALVDRRAEFAGLFVNSKQFHRGLGHRIFSEVALPLLNPSQFLQANLDAVTTPNVLDAIEATFAADTTLKGFLKTVLTSRWYQLTTATDDATNDPLLARRTLRRQHAEVIDSALNNLTGATLAGGNHDFLMQVYGFPFERLSQHERVDAVNMSQALVVLNSPVVQDRIRGAQGNVAGLAADVSAGTITVAQAIDEIFKAALSRTATADEQTDAQATVTGAANVGEGLQDVAAAVAATIEFSMR